MRNNSKKYLIILASIMLLFSFLPFYSVNKTEAFVWDPVRWILCGKEQGEQLLKAQRTDYLEFIKYSKSAIGTQDNSFDVSNEILKIAGYGDDNVDGGKRNPFDIMLFSGLNFSSYRGEFKFYLVDPCLDSENQEAVSSKFGQFYEDRREPLTTSGERASTMDVRTKVYQEGLWSAFIKSAKDRIANLIFSIAKLVVSLTLAFISLSLTDVSELFGLTQAFQEDIFMKFYNGFFLPLASIMFVFTAGYLAYQGLIKKNYRQAVTQGLVKTIACFVLAIAIATHPALMSLPNKIATTGQALVISSMSSGFESKSTDLCETEIGFEEAGDVFDKDYLNKMSQGLKSVIGCRMWSEFLLKPFIIGQFGSKYEDLNELGNVNSKWVGEPTVKLGESYEQNNWGLFYVSTMSRNHTALDGKIAPNVGKVHRDYYRIIDALSNYDEDFYLNENKQEMGSQELTEADSVLVTNDEDRDYSKGYVQVQDNAPLEQWSYFIGNHNGNRIAYAGIAALFSIIGSLVPLMLSLGSIIYGLSLTLLIMFAPFFLLIGCWGGRGNDIFIQYAGTLISTVIKKIVCAGLLLLSILLISNTMELVDEVGFFISFVFLIVVTIVFVKNKDKIINNLSRISMPQMNTEGVEKTKAAIKKPLDATKDIVTGAVAGGIATKSFKGAGAGMEEAIRNRAYRTQAGRTANIVYESKSKKMAQAKSTPTHCIECGVEITEDSTVFVNAEGSYVCYDCASLHGFEDLEEVIKDNVHDLSIEMANKYTKVPVERVNENGEKSLEVLTVMSYDDMRDFGYYNKTNTTLKYHKEEAIQKIKDTKEILELQLDNYKVISKVNIPEPLQDRVNPLEIARLAKQGNTAQVKNILIKACNDMITDIKNRTQEEEVGDNNEHNEQN